MGIGGIGHRLDAAEVDAQAYGGCGLPDLRLACLHGLGTAQALLVELDKRHTLRRQVRQQLHAMPDQLQLDLRVAGAQLRECAIELTLADQAPGANEVEERINTQYPRHGDTSLTALAGA